MNVLLFSVIVLVFVLLTVFAAGLFTWALCLAALTLGAAFLIFSVWTRGRDESGTAWFEDTSLRRTVAVTLVLLALTALPLPTPLTRVTGGTRFAHNRSVVEALQDARRVELDVHRAKPAFSLSRNRAGSLRILMLGTAVVSLAGAVALLQVAWRLALLRALLAIGCAVAAAGLLSLTRYPQGDTVWWTFPIAHGLPGPVACFVNRNHLGAFLALLAPASIALTVTDARRRRWLGALSGLSAFVLMGVATVATQSRGALIAWTCAIAATAALYGRRRGRRLAVASALLGAALLGLAVAASPGLRERLQALRDPAAEDSVQTRLAAWQGCVAIWTTYPACGAGPNAFRVVYPQHRRTASSGYMTHAENEYLQGLAECGLIGLLSLLAVAIAMRRLARDGTHDRDPQESALRIAAGGAVAAAAVHACFEFALHTPLVALTLAALVGLAYGARPPSPRPCVAGGPRLASVVLALALCGAPFWRPMGRLDATGFYPQAGVADLARALQWAPTSWQAWYHLGREACLRATPESLQFGRQCIERAVVYDPRNYQLWLQLGRLQLSLGDRAAARESFARVKALRWWVQVPDIPTG